MSRNRLLLALFVCIAIVAVAARSSFPSSFQRFVSVKRSVQTTDHPFNIRGGATGTTWHLSAHYFGLHFILAKKESKKGKDSVKKGKSKKAVKKEEEEKVEIEEPVAAACEVQESKTDLATAILQKKRGPNVLLADDAVTEDDSYVAVSKSKMTELNLLDGDIVQVKGKKRKTTLAIVNSDSAVPEGKVRIGKVARSNIG